MFICLCVYTALPHLGLALPITKCASWHVSGPACVARPDNGHLSCSGKLVTKMTSLPYQSFHPVMYICIHLSCLRVYKSILSTGSISSNFCQDESCPARCPHFLWQCLGYGARSEEVNVTVMSLEVWNHLQHVLFSFLSVPSLPASSRENFLTYVLIYHVSPPSTYTGCGLEPHGGPTCDLRGWQAWWKWKWCHWSVTNLLHFLVCGGSSLTKIRGRMCHNHI